MNTPDKRLPPVGQFDHATLTAIATRSRNDDLATRAAAEIIRRHADLTYANAPGITAGRRRALTDAIAAHDGAARTAA